MRTIATATLAIFALAAVAPEAQAHWSCVSTSAELQQALTDASDGGFYNGEDNTIAVMQGIYATGAATNQGPFSYYSTAPHKLWLQGGYIANCSTWTRKAGLSILDAQHATAVLAMHGMNAQVSVEDLTLQNGESAEPGAGLQINYQVAANAIAYAGDNIIRENHSTVGAGGVYISGKGSGLHNNLIAGNSGDGPFGGAYIISHSVAASVDQNTVTRNMAGSAPVIGGVYCGGNAICYVSDNIIWNNAHYGLVLGVVGSQLYYNDIGATGGFPPSASSLGNLSLQPGFVDPVHGDFHLAGTSPLLNMVPTTFQNNWDLDGTPYSQLFPPMDPGAYQYTP